MKLATPQALLQVLAATPETRQVAAERLSGISPLLFDTAQLERLTAEGFLEACVISYNQVPVYCVWFHCSVDRGLHVNAAVGLSGTDNFMLLVQAIEAFARKRNCVFIRFNTRRPGLITKAEAAGYLADSLTMIKKL